MESFLQNLLKNPATAFISGIVAAFIIVRPSFNLEQANTKEQLSNQYAAHISQQQKVIHGIDVSHDQGHIDWTKVSKTDVRFVYHKATDGMTYLDPNFHENMTTLSQQSKILYGAYHFFEAEDPPDKQAENFLKHLLVYPVKLKPMIDVEVTRSQKPDVIKKRLQLFIDQVQDKTGCAPIIYSYRDFWEQNIGPDFNHYIFWLADYTAKMEPPKHAENLQIWQYSESGVVNGISGPVDLDVIVKGEQGLQKLLCNQEGER